jgi:hypothetical protein
MVTKLACKTMINSHEKKNWLKSLNSLLLIALLTDLLTPFLIWKGVIPAQVRWASHMALAFIILFCFCRMLVYNQIPPMFWLIVAYSLIWVFVALARGQGLVPTIWGWWLTFQFPFVALFLYLGSFWPTGFPKLFRTAILAILALEVAVQCVQYLQGEIIGDDLAGSFGQKGTGNLILFILVVDSLFLGHWTATKKGKGMIIALLLSLVSSVLGEMKLFFVGLLGMGLIAFVMYAIRYRTFLKLLIYSGLFILTLLGYMYIYNAINPYASNTPIQTYLTDPQALYDYLNFQRKYYINGSVYTDMGRNAALMVGWESIQSDPVTFLFGWGIGSRSESNTLGTAGLGIEQGDLGLTSGTGLLVKMQETGVIGLAFLGCFFLWVIVRMFKGLARRPDSEASEIRYALILFTILFPILLWYNNAWILRVPMLLYWTMLAYTLSEATGFSPRVKTTRDTRGLEGEA